jgi:hypothetical protein
MQTFSRSAEMQRFGEGDEVSHLADVDHDTERVLIGVTVGIGLY